MTQEDRDITINTPLGPDAFLLKTLSGTERLGQLFAYDMDLISKDPDIQASSMVGQNVTAIIVLTDGSERYFNGFVSL